MLKMKIFVNFCIAPVFGQSTMLNAELRYIEHTKIENDSLSTRGHHFHYEFRGTMLLKSLFHIQSYFADLLVTKQ